MPIVDSLADFGAYYKTIIRSKHIEQYQLDLRKQIEGFSRARPCAEDRWTDPLHTSHIGRQSHLRHRTQLSLDMRAHVIDELPGGDGHGLPASPLAI